MSEPTSFSSIILGSGLVTTSGNNLYIDGNPISGNIPSDIVRTTGDQIINGTKTMGSHILLSGNLIGATSYYQINLNTPIIYDGSFNSIIDLGNRFLYSTGYVFPFGLPKSIPSIDWQSRVLYRSGISHPALKYGNISGLEIYCRHLTGALIPTTNNMFTVQVNETTNQLSFIVKYSDSTVKSGSISLS